MGSATLVKAGLAISVEFLHGTFRADPTGIANTGQLTEGEWPPSPSRLFAALVSSDGTGIGRRVTLDVGLEELKWLEEQPPPVIYADASDLHCHQPLEARYVVESTKHAQPRFHQEFVGRKASLVRPGVRVAPRHTQVVFQWDARPPVHVLNALRFRCARVGYLGAADSPVRLRVATELPVNATASYFAPCEDGDIRVSVPAPGHLAALDQMYEQWIEFGPSVSRAHFPALQHAVQYRSPRKAKRKHLGQVGQVVAWLRIGAAQSASGGSTSSISGRRISAVASLFKAAVLRQYENLFGEPPPVLHGHYSGEKGYDLARFLALPDVGFSRSRGRIHGLGLWMPANSDQLTRNRARDAARAVRRLAGHGIDVRVTNHAGERRPWAANPNRWVKEARRWVTAFPAIHERHRRLDIREISRWCGHAGLPEPLAFRSARKPLIRGAVDLSPVEMNRPGRNAMPYSHIELLFAHPVRGPIAIGSGRQRGFGLCVPVEESKA